MQYSELLLANNYNYLCKNVLYLGGSNYGSRTHACRYNMYVHVHGLYLLCVCMYVFVCFLCVCVFMCVSSVCVCLCVFLLWVSSVFPLCVCVCVCVCAHHVPDGEGSVGRL